MVSPIFGKKIMHYQEMAASLCGAHRVEIRRHRSSQGGLPFSPAGERGFELGSLRRLPYSFTLPIPIPRGAAQSTYGGGAGSSGIGILTAISLIRQALAMPTIPFASFTISWC